jgi:cation:H+ antiporter
VSTWIWVLVLIAAVWAAHWGAEKLAHPLKKLRRQRGFSAAAGGSFIGIAAASPEIGINIASAFRGVADIGLGAAIGSNILAIPIVVTVAYIATRTRLIGGGKEQQGGDQANRTREPSGEEEDRQRGETDPENRRGWHAQKLQSDASEDVGVHERRARAHELRAEAHRELAQAHEELAEAEEERARAPADGKNTGKGKRSREQGQEDSGEDHEQHLQHRLLRIRKQAVTVQALPYLAILVLFAALVLPAGWRGLQPMDGWILLGAYLVYLAQALLRGREEGEQVDWTRKEVGLALGGLLVLAVGAYFTVRATENIVSALGIQKIVGGLFITAPMAVLPEMFAVWSVTRSGQVTAATTSVIGDHAVTMTVAFLPLALVGLPVEDLQLFAVNLAFATLVAAAYAALIHWGHEKHGFTRWQVAALDGIYVAYIAVMLFWVLNVF